MTAVLPLLQKLDAAIERQIANDCHVAGAARIYTERLRAVKALFNLDWLESQIVRDWLREFEFSDGRFMAGGKLENGAEAWEDEAEVEFYECPVCKTACSVEGDILKVGDGDVDEAAEVVDFLTEEGYPVELGADLCPLCGTRMELVLLDTGDIPIEMLHDVLGDAKALLEEGGPYPTLELNAAFSESLRGGYPHIGWPEREDLSRARDQAEEGIWAEYLEPEGIWDFLAEQIGPLGHEWLIGERSFKPDIWDAALEAHDEGDINATALAILALRLEVPDENLKATPILSVADSELGQNLFDFIQTFRAELDEVELDLPRDDWSPTLDHEEQSVADNAASGFEREMFAFWWEQAKASKPVADEETGKPCWAAFWKPEDVAYGKAHFYAIVNGASPNDARDAANRARLQFLARNAKLVGVSALGIQLSSGRKFNWIEAAQMSRQLRPANCKIVTELRQLWLKADEDRPRIAKVGLALARV